MGNCFCCQNKGPCDSAEEASLLQNDTKAAVPSAETPGALSVGGTCGPGIEEDISKGQLNKDAETETYSTQENGTLQKSSLQTTNKSPQHLVNSTNSQSVDKRASTADLRDAEHQHSTPQMGRAQAHWEASKTSGEEDDKATEEDKCLNGTPAEVCTEPPSLPETNHKQEHSIMDTINNNEECQVPLDTCVDKPCTESVEKKVEVELPNTEPAAPNAQVLPISEINEEVDLLNSEPSNSVDKDDPEGRSSPACVEASHEEAQSHAPECSVGSLCSGVDHSSVEGETVSSDPQTTVGAEDNQSSQPDEKCVLDIPVKDTSEGPAAENPEGVKPTDSVLSVVCEEKPEETQEKAKKSSSEVVTAAEDISVSCKQEQLAQSSPPAVGGDTVPDETPVTAKEEAEDLGNSEEDLYRGAEELSAEITTTAGASSLSETSLRSEDRCSLAPAVDILSYSEREWKGNTAKSALIRKGYKEMSHKFSSLRRVRGDNYCALRATLYQILCHTTQIPEWLREESITMLPKELEAQEGLISRWIFPGECLQGDGTGDATQQLQGYMELLREKWQVAVACASSAERQQLCEQWFQGGEQELGLMEALKLLMLARAVELHASIEKGDDPPLFCWLLFARDSSDCPRSFLENHLSHMGLSAGLEQVEMFLLGYALQCTIQVYRLYKADTEEFVTFYPDDHKDEWPCVCLVTEDDRHYNVPVLLNAADPPKELKSS